MELKVECDCGQRYKFDVEPVHGRMPFPVNCPTCGADGTAKANALLQQSVGAAAPPPIRVAAVAGGSAGLRVAAAAPPVLGAAPAASAGAAGAPPPLRAIQAAGAKSRPGTAANYPLGAAGAVAAGFLAMLAWYFLIKLTGYEIGYAAWGVGVVTGLGARVLGRAGTTGLGVIAGACAFLAVIGGQFLAAKSQADKMIDEAAAEAYESRMSYALDAAKAESDEEIKALLIKHQESEQPTVEEISDFRKSELPKLKEFAAGKPNKTEFERDFKRIKDTFIYKLLLLKGSVGLFTLLWLFLGVGTAFRIGAK